jgi:CheY-like chemotaxis protein
MASDLLISEAPLAFRQIDDSQTPNLGTGSHGTRHSSAKHCPVLIVEDDADLREMMAQLLSLEGFDAATAANGREALQYLKKGNKPDVILLDLMMPVMDGWEFWRAQQADPELAQVPVIALSALDQTAANQRQPLDVAAFLKKPLDFDRLLQLVRQYCH